MPGENRDAHAGTGHRQPGQMQDLAGFVAQLLFLIGLTGAVGHRRSGQGNHVEGDRGRIGGRVGGRQRGAVEGQGGAILPGGRNGLIPQRRPPGQPRPRGRLVGRHDQPGQPGLVGQRLEHRHGGHGGAVRVGDDAAGRVAGVLGIHLAHHQGYLRVLPPVGGVIDHDRPGGRHPRGVVAGGGLSRRKQRDVQAGEVGGGHVLYRDPAITPRQRPAGGPGGGEIADFADREVALGKQPAQHPADLTGGSKNPNSHGRSLPGALRRPAGVQLTASRRDRPARHSRRRRPHRSWCAR